MGEGISAGGAVRSGKRRQGRQSGQAAEAGAGSAHESEIPEALLDRVHPGGGRLWGVLLLCRMADQEVSVGNAKGPDGGLYGDKGSPPQVLAQLLRQSQNRRRGEAAGAVGTLDAGGGDRERDPSAPGPGG